LLRVMECKEKEEKKTDEKGKMKKEEVKKPAPENTRTENAGGTRGGREKGEGTVAPRLGNHWKRQVGSPVEGRGGEKKERTCPRSCKQLSKEKKEKGWGSKKKKK